MTKPITVELTLDLDKHITAGYRQADEDEFVPEPATVEGVIIREAARLMFNQARNSSDHSDIYSDLRARVRAIRDEEIRAQLGPAIAEALTESFQPTNSMGQPKGEPVTLRELILGEAKAEVKRLVETKGDSFSRNPGRSALQELVRSEVGAAFQKELREAIDAAKTVLSETIKRAAETL